LSVVDKLIVFFFSAQVAVNSSSVDKSGDSIFTVFAFEPFYCLVLGLTQS